MNLLIAVVAVIAVTLLYTLFVRSKDIPPPDPVSPTQHLDERKAAIYENLRDLQFEYRVGKLSDNDYAQTKLALQKELAVVLAAIEQIAPSAAPKTAPASASPSQPAAEAAVGSKQAAEAAAGSKQSAEAAAGSNQAARQASVTVQSPAIACPHCGAEFATPMKFCGECGKAMA